MCCGINGRKYESKHNIFSLFISDHFGKGQRTKNLDEKIIDRREKKTNITEYEMLWLLLKKKNWQ